MYLTSRHSVHWKRLRRASALVDLSSTWKWSQVGQIFSWASLSVFLNCISQLYFSTLFLAAFPNCISHPAGHKLGKLGNKMGSSLKLGSRDLGALSEEPKEDFQVNRSTSSTFTLNNWFWQGFQQGSRGWWLRGWGGADGAIVQGDQPTI